MSVVVIDGGASIPGGGSSNRKHSSQFEVLATRPFQISIAAINGGRVVLEFGPMQILTGTGPPVPSYPAGCTTMNGSKIVEEEPK
jgi:hypothetical protein